MSRLAGIRRGSGGSDGREPEEFDAGTIEPMRLNDPESLKTILAINKVRHAMAREERDHKRAIAMDKSEWQVAMFIMAIAGVWLILDLVGVLVGSIDGGLGGTLANPAFAALAGVGGYKLSQHGVDQRR